MDKNKLTEQLRIIGIIYGALFIGQILFLVISLILVENKVIKTVQSLDETMKYFIPIVGLISMFLSHRLYLSNVSTAKAAKDINTKLMKYKSFKIVQWAIIEGASFFALVGFIFTRNYLYVIIFLFLIGYFFLSRPSNEQFKLDFNVD